MPERKIIFIAKESPEGGYEAQALGFPIITQANTLRELQAAVSDAVLCHFGELLPGGLKLRPKLLSYRGKP